MTASWAKKPPVCRAEAGTFEEAVEVANDDKSGARRGAISFHGDLLLYVKWFLEEGIKKELQDDPHILVSPTTSSILTLDISPTIVTAIATHLLII